MALQRAVRAHKSVSEGDQVNTQTLKAFSSFCTVLLLWYVGCAESAFEGLLQQCPAIWQTFQGLPTQSMASLSSTNRCLHSIVRRHLPSLAMVRHLVFKTPAQCIFGEIVCCLQHGSSLPSNAFQGWSALQTLTLFPRGPMYDYGGAPRVQLTDAAITCLAQCSLPELHSLYLGIAFNTEEAKAVANANLPKLHTLHVADGFPLPALQHLARGRWPCLKVLVIGPCTGFADYAYYPRTNFDPFAECNWPLLEKLSASRWSHIHLSTPEGQCKWPNLKTLTASCIHGQPGSCHPRLRSLVLREVYKPECMEDALTVNLPALRQYKVRQGSLH